MIESWSTDKQMTITAIGERRFLALDRRGYERVCTMDHQMGWTKVIYE